MLFSLELTFQMLSQVMLWKVIITICNKVRALLNELCTLLAMIRHAWILHACMKECMDKLKEKR